MACSMSYQWVDCEFPGKNSERSQHFASTDESASGSGIESRDLSSEKRDLRSPKQFVKHPEQQGYLEASQKDHQCRALRF